MTRGGRVGCGVRAICGIAGLFTRGGDAVEPAAIRAQCDAILHRGPDDDGVFVDRDFGFGMRRLSIVDIAGSAQPIVTSDRAHALVFNGEIYNFRALRAELRSLGHGFATAGDAEVVLAAWREWGDDAWRRLDGMFAVAVWDVAARTLTLARDPTGIKPLYYTLQPAGFAFGSELKALWPLPGFAFETDPAALHDYFSYGHVRGPRSIYRDVAVLPPGHSLTVTAHGAPRLKRYWRPTYAPDPAPSRDDWVEAFRAVWQRTVEAQLIADVEVGAFLSGGIDSSAVVAAMQAASDRPVRTFTIGFADPRFDESAHAARVAAHLGTRHTARTVELAAATDILPAVAACYDEPFADPAAVPTWYLSRLAADHVKVALSGDGGDELFFGYRRHRTERAVGRLPQGLRSAIRSFADWPLRGERLQRWQRTVAGAEYADGATRFFAKQRMTSDAVRRALLTPELYAACDGPGALERSARGYVPDPAAISPDPLDQFAFADLSVNLPSAMLTKLDRVSMAHSLEVRVPMLGREMVALALAMPADIKLNGAVGKDVVRRAIAPQLPPAITQRPKQGFRLPLAAWFAGDFGRYAQGLWHDGGAAQDGFLQGAAVDRLFEEHRSGRRDHARTLYAIAVYCLWRDADALRRASSRSSAPAPAPRLPAAA
ncbi:MAG: asparagine synthase (glutamine-hydrolyzing) [Pseudomonadota bacterium]